MVKILRSLRKGTSVGAGQNIRGIDIEIEALVPRIYPEAGWVVVSFSNNPISLISSNPKLMSVERGHVIQQRRVVINSHGEKLVGIFHDTGSKELVIVCHGIHSSKERIPMVNLAVALEKEGISAFRFDFAGNGESEGSFRYGNYRREADDLRNVVQHFRGVNRAITAIVGHSKGGNVVLLYAAKYKDIHTVVNISGRFDLERGMEGRLGKDFRQRIKQFGHIDVKNKKGKFLYRVTEESLMDRLTTDVQGACKTIDQNCRVLTVHGTRDKMVPVEDAFEFDKFVPNHQICIIEGAEHEYTSHQDELACILLDFIKADFPQKHNVSTKGHSNVHSRL